MYKKYFYYHKFDIKKEPLDKVLSMEYQGALEYFALRKRLSEDDFAKIYNIEEYESK